MKKYLFNSFLAASLLLPNFLFAQLPIGDGTWTNVKTDDFNSLDTTYWYRNYWGSNSINGCQYDDVSNVFTGFGYLWIKYEKLNSPLIQTQHDWDPSVTPSNPLHWHYKGGAVVTKPQYKYGYYEISAIMPSGAGFYPAFWVYASDNWKGYPGCSWYNEIDAVEIFGCQSITNDSIPHNMHILRSPYSSCTPNYTPSTLDAPVPNLVTERKHAFLWEKNKVTFFLDDKELSYWIDEQQEINHALHVIVNLSVHCWVCPPNGSTPNPSFLYVNWFKLWQLKKDCNKVENLCAYNNGTYDRKVKKSVAIGGGGCTPNIYTSDNPAFWATDFVELKEGTTITANGSGSFLAYVTPCPD